MEPAKAIPPTASFARRARRRRTSVQRAANVLGWPRADMLVDIRQHRRHNQYWAVHARARPRLLNQMCTSRSAPLSSSRLIIDFDECLTPRNFGQQQQSDINDIGRRTAAGTTVRMSLDVFGLENKDLEGKSVPFVHCCGFNIIEYEDRNQRPVPYIQACHNPASQRLDAIYPTVRWHSSEDESNPEDHHPSPEDPELDYLPRSIRHHEADFRDIHVSHIQEFHETNMPADLFRILNGLPDLGADYFLAVAPFFNGAYGRNHISAAHALDYMIENMHGPAYVASCFPFLWPDLRAAIRKQIRTMPCNQPATRHRCDGLRQMRHHICRMDAGMGNDYHPTKQERIDIWGDWNEDGGRSRPWDGNCTEFASTTSDLAGPITIKETYITCFCKMSKQKHCGKPWDLLCEGLPLNRILKAGGWTSPAIMRYLLNREVDSMGNIDALFQNPDPCVTLRLR